MTLQEFIEKCILRDQDILIRNNKKMDCVIVESGDWHGIVNRVDWEAGNYEDLLDEIFRKMEKS